MTFVDTGWYHDTLVIGITLLQYTLFFVIHNFYFLQTAAHGLNKSAEHTVTKELIHDRGNEMGSMWMLPVCLVVIKSLLCYQGKVQISVLCVQL